MPSPEALWRWSRQWRRENLQCDRAAVLKQVDEAAQLGPRYAFLVLMSCGIAMLGLLQNSVAVIIGAMLISPLMSPIIELGMSLATFDFRKLREALKTLAVGVGLALLISCLIVLVSPLRDPTPEILARTEPTLFDLLVAIFSGLAGAYTTITRRGEAIVGVAIATALMPPLAVVGFGIATGSGSIAGGAAFLFMTNLLAIALSVTIMARWYGFGQGDSPKQTAWQAVVIISSFVLLSIPLGLALRDIAARGLTERTIRSTMDAAARDAGGQITSLRVDRRDRTILIDAVLLTSTHQPRLNTQLERKLEDTLGQPVNVQLREVLAANDRTIANEQATLTELRESVDRLQNDALRDAEARRADAQAVNALKDAALAQMGEFELLQGGQQARWRLKADAGLDLAAARRLETALLAQPEGPRLQVIPALQPLPLIGFGDDQAELDATALQRLQDIAWAMQRWGMDTVEVEGYAGSQHALAMARAEAVRDWLQAHGLTVGLTEAATLEQARRLILAEGDAATRAVQVRVQLQ